MAGMQTQSRLDVAGDQANLPVIVHQHQYKHMPAGLAGSAHMMAGILHCGRSVKTLKLVAREWRHVDERGSISGADTVILPPCRPSSHR